MGSGQGHLSLQEVPSVQRANLDTSSSYQCSVPSKSLKLLSPLLTQEWWSLLNLNLYTKKWLFQEQRPAKEIFDVIQKEISDTFSY